METIFGNYVSPGRSVRWAKLSRKGFAVRAIHHGQPRKMSESIRDRTAAVHHQFLRPISRPRNSEILRKRTGTKGVGGMEKEVS